MPGLEIDFSAQVAASINGLTEELRADRRRKEDLAADVAFLETPPFSFAALPYAAAGWGPNRGFNWAVQSMVVSGLGATGDFINVYRGTTTAHAVGNNARFTFQTLVVGGVSAWHPGRTGFVLKGDESIVFAGSFTTGPVFVNVDVIQLTDAQLPYFLL
jgi:hypothetical protein